MNLLLQLDQQGTSSYITALSASYAPTVGLTANMLIPSGSTFLNFQYVNGLLISANEYVQNNVLQLFTTSGVTIISNPTGEIDDQIADWTKIIANNCINMTSFYCYSSPNLTYLDFSGSTSIVTFNCSDCVSLASLDISSFPLITYLDASSCALTQDSIDSILTNLVNFGLLSGSVLLQTNGGLGASNGTPSAGGYSSASLLTARAWSVTTN